jgi:hypothetical protein
MAPEASMAMMNGLEALWSLKMACTAVWPPARPHIPRGLDTPA